uniref:Uncharacterized protein n=1 Tax=Branchiostoma floridae TaxID=7739 RepID=C3YWX5_BRAFL|eukprot:XP_002599357.1 hypothetical protein BRAFLDRAFT_64286 [Branchiostoma floridae]
MRERAGYSTLFRKPCLTYLVSRTVLQSFLCEPSVRSCYISTPLSLPTLHPSQHTSVPPHSASITAHLCPSPLCIHHSTPLSLPTLHPSQHTSVPPHSASITAHLCPSPLCIHHSTPLAAPRRLIKHAHAVQDQDFPPAWRIT